MLNYWDKNGELLNAGDIVKIDGRTTEYGTVTFSDKGDYVVVSNPTNDIKYPLNASLSLHIERVLEATSMYDRHIQSKKMRRRVGNRMEKRAIKKLAKIPNNYATIEKGQDESAHTVRAYRSDVGDFRTQKRLANRKVRHNKDKLFNGCLYKKYVGSNNTALQT